MLTRPQSFALGLLTIFAIYAGFSKLHQAISHAPTAPSSSSVAPSATNPKISGRRLTIPRSADRDSAFSTYNNPDYSITFRYPRIYSLTENGDDTGNNSSLKSQDQLAAEQSGLLLIASIEIPDDAYPNTTFSSGTLQFAVNPSLTALACHALAAPDETDTRDLSLRDTTGADAIHGLVFDWLKHGEFANHRDYSSRNYFAYSGGSCYEFFLQVTDIVPTGIDLDPAIKPADSPKILHTLEKIVSTTQIRNKP